MKLIEISGIKEIGERISETKVGQYDLNESTFLLLKTSKNAHFFLNKLHNNDGDSVMHSVFGLEHLNNLTGSGVYREIKKRDMEDLYWEIYDEIVGEIGVS